MVNMPSRTCRGCWTAININAKVKPKAKAKAKAKAKSKKKEKHDTTCCAVHQRRDKTPQLAKHL